MEELPASAVAGEILHRVFRPKGPDGTARSPWWFASVPTESDQVGGRFDLVPPNGACYFALSAVGAVLEAMQGFEVGIIPLEELSVRRRVELIAPDSAPEAADLSAPEVYGLVGITAALWAGGDEDQGAMSILRAKSQRWAQAMFDAGWGALRHGIQHDPAGVQRAVTLLDVGGAHLPFDDLEWEAVCESHELDDDHELHEALRARGLQVVRSDVDLPLVTLEDLLSATFVGL